MDLGVFLVTVFRSDMARIVKARRRKKVALQVSGHEPDRAHARDVFATLGRPSATSAREGATCLIPPGWRGGLHLLCTSSALSLHRLEDWGRERVRRVPSVPVRGDCSEVAMPRTSHGAFARSSPDLHTIFPRRIFSDFREVSSPDYGSQIAEPA